MAGRVGLTLVEELTLERRRVSLPREMLKVGENPRGGFTAFAPEA